MLRGHLLVRWLLNVVLLRIAERLRPSSFLGERGRAPQGLRPGSCFDCPFGFLDGLDQCRQLVCSTTRHWVTDGRPRRDKTPTQFLSCCCLHITLAGRVCLLIHKGIGIYFLVFLLVGVAIRQASWTSADLLFLSPSDGGSVNYF